MFFPKPKKGAEMSLNVIIVAAIALIVLVILVAIFTGRIRIFQSEVGIKGDAELTSMRITYGTCHPTAGQESTFTSEFGKATAVDAKESAKTSFAEVISSCSGFSSDKATCEGNSCKWS
ncbi:MAG: hypothetical protein V2A62_05645 [Candidatus Woesearchaeota archaeon]